MREIIVTSLVVLALALAALSGFAAITEPGMLGPSSVSNICVDNECMTRYSFGKDAAINSNCIDAGAKEWPPLEAEKDSNDSGKWTVVARAGGLNMWPMIAIRSTHS